MGMIREGPVMDRTDADGRQPWRETLDALDVLRHAKNLFFWLALVAVALHVASWVIVRHTDTLDPLRPITLHNDDGHAAARPVFTDTQRNAAGRWKLALRSALTLGGFVGRASALVLTGVFVVSLLVSLPAGRGGTADLAKACVWSLAALAMLVPWLRAPEDVAGVASAFYGWEDLSRTTLPEAAATGGALSVFRFLICPILVAVCLLVAQRRSRSAYARITTVPGAKLPIHEV